MQSTFGQHETCNGSHGAHPKGFVHSMLSRCTFPSLNGALRNLPRFASTSTGTPSKPDVKVNKSEVTIHQSPNYPTTWSTSQHPRPGLQSGPRFEQTDISLQPNPLSAIELIAQEPIRLVQGRKAVCDGGPFTTFSRLSDLFGMLIQEVDHLAIQKFTSTWYVDFDVFFEQSPTLRCHFQDQPGPRPCG